MSNKSKHINVRFDSELHDVVEEIAKEKRISKSDVVRQAIEGQLSLMDNHKKESLSDKEREIIMDRLGKILTVTSQIKRNNILFGNNVNQIAKAVNMGMVPEVSDERLDEMRDFGQQHVNALRQFSKEVDALWRILV